MSRFAAVAALLLATAVVVVSQPRVNLALGRGALAATPTRFGSWSGTELSFEDAVLEELAPDDLLVRRYQRDDEIVWLCMVYHRHRRYGAHDPRLCYESQGYTLDVERRVHIDDGLVVNRFVADRRTDRRVVLYWWVTDGMSTPDATAFRNRLAVTGVLENRAWGAFVRVEALVRGGDEARADQAARDFAVQVAAALPAVFAQAENAAAAPAAAGSGAP